MDDAPSRRRVLAAFGGSLVLSVGVAGCLGNGDGSGVDGEPVDEPDEFPPGFRDDGIEIEVLIEAVASVLMDGSFMYEGAGTHVDIGAESQEGEAIRLAADTDNDVGFSIVGESPVAVTDPTEALEVEKWYVEGDQAFEVENFGEPEPIDKDFEDLARVVDRHFQEVLDVVRDIGWGDPSWDVRGGHYVVNGVDLDGTRPPVAEATLRVSPGGIPVGLSGRVEQGAGPSHVEIVFTPDIDVDRPDWVDEAF